MENGGLAGVGTINPRIRRKTRIGHLPWHLLVEILLWLPVKSLLRCKCVRRSWNHIVNYILKNPVFVSDHFKRSCMRPSLLVRMPICSLRRTRKKIVKGLAAIGTGFFLDSFIARSSSAFLEYFHDSITCRYTYGCHGIVCVYNLDCSTIVLMNPSLGRFKVLNRSWLCRGTCPIRWQYIGFGRDVVDNVYKLVRIVFNGADNPAEICTFDSKKKVLVWRKIDGRTDYKWCGPPRQDQQVSCNGVYYWLGATVGEQIMGNLILSFDMHSETFQPIPCPVFDGPVTYPTRCSLLVWRNEQVVLLRYCKVGTREIDAKAVPSPIDMWVFQECSWSKFLTVPPLDNVYYPLAFWKDDELILKSFSYSSEGDHFASFNVLTKTYTRFPGITELEDQIYVSRYVPSLFWIH